MLDRLHIIKGLRTERPARLHLVYDDGQKVVVDLGPIIRAGGVFRALRNWTLFTQAALDEHGRAVRWPGDIDLCADALRLEGQRTGARRASHRPRRSARVRASGKRRS